MKRIKLAIRVGDGIPDIIFDKKSEDFYSDGRRFFWDETIMSFDTGSEHQRENAMLLWREFFDDVSHFDKYRIEEIIILYHLDKTIP